jgi:hypothetical protein
MPSIVTALSVKRWQWSRYTRESLAIDLGRSLKEEDVAHVLNDIVAKRGLPATIKTDNGSEFIGKVMMDRSPTNFVSGRSRTIRSSSPAVWNLTVGKLLRRILRWMGRCEMPIP